MSIMPISRPGIRRSKVEAILLAHGVDINHPAILGVRGYYLNTMGVAGKNDVGKYDDAVIVISPTAYVTYNANCDPSLHRYRMANLCEGVWKYRVGVHGISRPAYLRYKALTQAAEVTVDRDGAGPDTGYFGINIHRGGEAGTSSLGCQTLPPSQWNSFIELVESELERSDRQVIPYCLVSNEHGDIA